ncbi:P-loop containing nucleoside triphosphate hydrolase protein [Chaetomium fimeti]|uniref:P-loop containing nucleoside triphosphate hydrolase protein n=1 Tax=Chaetomium fimeti TaxID=1854472 RepID=A0AAE0HLI4_9PEZI|nr:P-loop containing nucleoside triphosphate hydrolase protein [Chaetomium fimeti]
MAGGRPQPGSLLRRMGTPSALETVPAPANVAAAGANGHRAFEFTFESAVRPGTMAPPPTPVGSDDGAPMAALVSPARPPAVRPPAAATTYTTIPACWPLARPVLGGGGLYGQAYHVGQGNLRFETSPRMEDWLGRLEAFSFGRQEEEEEEEEKETVSAAAQGGSTVGEGTALDTEESVRAGEKRSAPPPTTNPDDDDDETNEPAPKRSRISTAFQRTFSRLSSRAWPTTTTTTSTTPLPSSPLVPASSAYARPATAATIHPAGRTNPLPPFASAFAPGFGYAPGSASRSPPPPSLRPGPGRVFSPFSLLSRVGSAVPSEAAPRTVKVCLVGDVGAGKTALFNRLVGNVFVSNPTSLVPDFKSVIVQAEDRSSINVELWDFPGIVASGARPGPLLSTFFHAAVVCFSLEDKDNLRNIADVWKPKLDACLHDQHVFVLGLKRDLRPAYPTLDLSFLPTAERATAEMGQQAAGAINASGYGECSALTNDNIQGVWEGMINHVITNLDEREKSNRTGRKRGRAKTAVTGFLDKCGMNRFGKDRERE